MASRSGSSLRGGTGGVATTNAAGQLQPDDLRQIGVSIGKYVTTSSSAAAFDAAVTTLLANEQFVYLPRGTWPWNGTEFTMLADQVFRGAGGGRFDADPGSTILSRLQVPSGYSSGNLFTIPDAAKHVLFKDFFVDGSAASATSTGLLFNCPDSAGAETWLTLDHVHSYGPIGRFLYGGTLRRAITCIRTAAFRNGGLSTSSAVMYDMHGTDWVLDNCRAGSGNLLGNAAIGVKAYGSVGTIIGGDYWGWGTNIDWAGTNIVIDGVRSDLASQSAIFIEATATGLLDNVNLHSNGQDTDNTYPHIKVACLGGVVIGKVHVWQDTDSANACNWAVQGSGGGWANISRMVVNNTQGVGSGVKPVRTGDVSMTQGALTFGATMNLQALAVRQRSNIARVTLTANMTGPTMDAGYDGEVWRFDIIQDATGSRTIAWPANAVNFLAPTAAASSHTVFDAVYDSASAKWRRIGV